MRIIFESEVGFFVEIVSITGKVAEFLMNMPWESETHVRRRISAKGRVSSTEKCAVIHVGRVEQRRRDIYVIGSCIRVSPVGSSARAIINPK